MKYVLYRFPNAVRYSDTSDPELYFYDSSEKDVPILCHRGQKFSILYKHPVFVVHTAVKYNQFQYPI